MLLVGALMAVRQSRPGAVRTGVGSAPAWNLVFVLTGVSAIGGFLGARLADRVDTNRLSTAFTVLAVASYTAARALPALV